LLLWPLLLLYSVFHLNRCWFDLYSCFSIPSGFCTHMTSSLLGSHVREGREHVATVSPTRTRWVSQE
ncbi:hypothetical protein GBAR_LOCUS4181, partial [Geodia barretti]